MHVHRVIRWLGALTLAVTALPAVAQGHPDRGRRTRPTSRTRCSCSSSAQSPSRGGRLRAADRRRASGERGVGGVAPGRSRRPRASSGFRPGSPSLKRCWLEADPVVQFAEPNWIYTHDATSDDPYYGSGSCGGCTATAPARRTRSAARPPRRGHAGTSAAAVYVAVIDEGIMFTHQDLDGQVWTNRFDPVDGVDNDGNGTSTTRTAGTSRAATPASSTGPRTTTARTSRARSGREAGPGSASPA